MENKSLLDGLMGKDSDREIRVAAIAGLNEFDTEAAAKEAASLLAEMKDNEDPSRLIRSLLSQKGGDVALTNALKKTGEIAPDVAKVSIRAARSTGREVDALVKQLAASANMIGETKLTKEQRLQMLADAEEQGDAANGENVYRRGAIACQRCHAIGGAGGKVGPDLASIGASAPADYILDSLLDPGAKIKENYHSQVIATDEGQVITGVLVRQTDDSLILRDAEDTEISIPLDSIEAKKDGGSLMPAGLLNELTRQESLDLLKFLTELGKVGNYSTPRAPLVRSWETIDKTAADLVQNKSELATVTDESLPWTPAYSRVNGVLPQSELPSHQNSGSDKKVTYSRFPIEMTTDGKRTLKMMRAGDGVRLYVDGKRMTSDHLVELELAKGVHSVLLVVDYDAGLEPIAVLIE
jgi:putative heme-binding domain-containing protein